MAGIADPARLSVAIESLRHDHLEALVKLVEDSPPEYSRFFAPFPLTVGTFDAILRKKNADQYFLVLHNGEPAGFYMLRGWDEGYSTPAYGVWIAHKFKGRGLAAATLEHAINTSKALGSAEIMLKVHPENLRAKELYERFEFKQVGFDERTQNLVYKRAL
jgi:RimJ/RimL family protein N-acetyltransferase